MTKARIIGCIIGLFVAAQAMPLDARSPKLIERSVVKVIAVASDPYYYQPWQTGSQTTHTGSGVVIEGNKVLTNAHVVANQTFVQVRRQGDPNKYQANVLVAGHDCDLALLEVKDPNFHQGIKPIDIGKTPWVRDKVVVFGFPIGGDKLSITEGVVSRIEMGQYNHCRSRLLQIQIDAAINPGNSGGPVIKNGKIVGIAFQGFSRADNVGYMIPPPVIRHFLADVEDGDYDGFPTLGIKYQKLENPDHRMSLGMEQDQTGVMIKKVAYNSSAWNRLAEGDVILSVEGETVANDGTIPFMDEERIAFPYFLLDKFLGDTATLGILREGHEIEIKVPLRMAQPVISKCEYDVMPSYYIFGGLVFSPLTLNYLDTWGEKWWYQPVRLRFHFLMDMATPDEEQLAILQYVLADEVNVGYHNMRSLVVERVNGEKVKNLKDLIDKIESSNEKFIKIETESHNRVVLSKEAALAANSRILERYRIPADRSEDLQESNVQPSSKLMP